MRYYELYGCLVATDLDLGSPEAPSGMRPAQLTLLRASDRIDQAWQPREHDVLVRAHNPERNVGYVGARTADGLRLRIESVCEFDLHADLCEVRWQALPDVDHGMVAVLASGALMAFRHTVAGHLVLHSSAVLARGHGLAFVAASGMGKSTMATLLCASGAKMITDDVGRIDFAESAVRIWPGGGESRLRPAAASLEALFNGEASARTTSDGRAALLLPRVTGDPAPLDAIVVPLPSRERTTLELHRMSPAEALVVISHFPRILGWVDQPVQDQQFNLLADLVERVPVYTALVPWGPPFSAATGVQLLDELGWSTLPVETSACSPRAFHSADCGR